MTRIDLMETSDLVAQFAQAAKRSDDAIQYGTTKEANRQHAVANRIFKELEKRGAERELLSLLVHPYPVVRHWAAVNALKFAPEIAAKILEDLAQNEPDFTGLAARVSLQLWREGKLPSK